MDTTDETVDKLGMTDEQWEWFQKATHGYGEQDENGIDISLLRENLKLSPSERLQRHRRALGLVQEMQHAGRDTGFRCSATHT